MTISFRNFIMQEREGFAYAFDVDDMHPQISYYISRILHVRLADLQLFENSMNPRNSRCVRECSFNFRVYSRESRKDLVPIYKREVYIMRSGGIRRIYRGCKLPDQINLAMDRSG